MEEDLEFYKRLLKRELGTAVKEELKKKETYNALILGVDSGVITLKTQPTYFETGDVICQVIETENGKRFLREIGNVISYDRSSGILLLLQKNQTLNFKEMERVKILESEVLTGFEVQLNLIDRAISKDLTQYGILALKLFFDDLPQEELKFLENIHALRKLDFSQRKVVEAALALDNGEVLLVIGPPGTGKTHTISAIAEILALQNKKVLITSHTNRAVDNAIEKLDVKQALRVGLPEKVTRNIQPYMLSFKAETELGYRFRNIISAIENVTKEINNLERKGASKTVLREKKIILKNLLIERKSILNSIIDDLVEKTPIIGSTLIKSQLAPLSSVDFEYIIIDEASQASIPLALLGMVKGKKWILVGDPYQLLPIFRTVDEIYLPELSAFTTLLKKYKHRALWLRRHYRSNHKIIGFSQQYIYHGEIEPAEICYSRRLKINPIIKKNNDPLYEIFDPEIPILAIHVNSKHKRVGDSKINKEEAKVAIKLIKVTKELGIDSKNIGIITPYKAQKILLAHFIKNIEINTVDAFQGREKDIIIFLTTSTGSLDFVSNPNRLNVAVTRAVYKFILVGNLIKILKKKKKLIYSLVRYITRNGGIFSWEKKDWLYKK